jgi:hypothetical protein
MPGSSTGIAICQIAVVIQEYGMSLNGTKQTYESEVTESA